MNRTRSIPKSRCKTVKDPLRVLSQNCSERMVLAAAAKFNPALAQLVSKRIEHAYRNIKPNDIQIDLLAFIAIRYGEKNKIKYCGKSEAEFLAGIRDLNRSKLYFLRTGTNGGAGHYQLFYSNAKGEWCNRSSNKNNYPVTNNQGQMTLLGKRLLRPFGNWGVRQGEYVYVFTEVTEDMLLPCIQYIIDVRTRGEEQAIQRIFA